MYCMWNKSSIFKTIGSLYSLLVLDNYFDNINIDFIGLLPIDEGYNMLIAITN